ncbi:MAG: DNA damage-inducible protein 1 [Peltula sp. TS41687]|nr:MAG: DNA damage-inducible protein 1 [Peltula sp. TS41687]
MVGLRHRRLTISIATPEGTTDQDLLTLDLHGGITVADLKALIQSETDFPGPSQHLYHNGQLLTDQSKTLETLGIVDGEMLAMHVRGAASNMNNHSAPTRSTRAAVAQRQQIVRPPMVGHTVGMAAESGQGAGPGPRPEDGAGRPDPEMIRLQILGNPSARAELQRRNPELADALNDSDRFRELYNGLQSQQAEEERRRQQEIAMLNDDPFNPEAQAKIEELIRREAVMENLQNALEFHPEGEVILHHSITSMYSTNPVIRRQAFGRVHMLYIDVEVNGHKIKAFVDSGAQATIMSRNCAEDCGIMRLVDRRFAGVARGVGTAETLGRVHSAQIKIGALFLPCSFTVMEGKHVDLLLGLDMLKSYQACIDLHKGKLIIRDQEIPFLGEADIPKHFEEDFNEPMVEGPAGTKVGAKSGAVVQTANGPGMAGSSSSEAGPSHFRGAGRTLGGAGQPTASQPGAAAAQPPRQANSAAPSQSQHSPEAIEQLQQLGFSRDEAIAALNATGGNVDYAAGLLFQER